MFSLDKIKIFIFSILAVILAVPTMAAVPVLAAGETMIHAPAALNSPTGTGQSFNWSGYEATGGTFTGIGATWTIPTVAATSSLTADATWVGIGGVTTHDLIQVGTQAVTGNGSSATQYQAWFETLPQTTQQLPLTVNAGDSVTASVTQISANEWQVSFKDNTTGGQYSTQVPYASSLSSAEWIEESPSDQDGILPIDNFGAVSFTGAYTIMNGSNATIAGANAEPLTLVNTSGQVLAAPSALGSDSASFTITRTTASAGSIGTPGSLSLRGRGHRVGVGIQGFSSRVGRVPGSSFPSTPLGTSIGMPTGRNDGRFGFSFNFGNSNGWQMQFFRMNLFRNRF